MSSAGAFKNGKRSSFRLPRGLEIELAKFLGTIGFADYGTALWDLATRSNGASTEAKEPISAAILRQIKDQARFDPAVLAAGEAALPHLPARLRTLQTCWGVTAPALFDQVGAPPRVIVAVARLDAETTKKAGRVLEALAKLEAGPCLVVVTDQGREEAPFDASAERLSAQTLFWRDQFSGHGAADPRLFAMFVHVLGAPVFVSLTTRLGFETIGRYGLALHRFHRLFAILDVPPSRDTQSFKDIHYLRMTSAYATTLAMSDAEAAVLRSYAPGLEGPGIAILPSDISGDRAPLAAIFGQTFEDRRSPVSQVVLPRLLYGQGASIDSSNDVPGDVASDFDVTVTIVFHRERELAVPALASLAAMIDVAKDAGLKIEARAMLDRSDDLTRALLRANGMYLDEIREVDFGDLGLTRNAGTALARGLYLSFLDGDDLWGADWLLRCHRAAVARPGPPTAIWHPESYYLFLASDCGRSSRTDAPDPLARSAFYQHQTSTTDDFERRDLLLENLWTANAFAPTTVFRRFPYRPNDWARQAGIEDWRWNLETLAAGLPHCVVPQTVHLVREKEGGSLGQMSDAVGLLPIFT